MASYFGRSNCVYKTFLYQDIGKGASEAAPFEDE